MKKTRSICGNEGFTLIELAIVVMIIGTLAAIAIPSYMRFTVRAKEASVRQNMHVVQTGVEMFAVDNAATYPQAADAAAVQANMPGGTFPANPFTKVATAVAWDADPSNPGEITITTLAAGGYAIKGFGKSVVLSPTIQVGN